MASINAYCWFEEGNLFPELFKSSHFLPLKWDRPEDRLGVIGLGFAAVVTLWASANLITWLVYHYLLFKPDK